LSFDTKAVSRLISSDSALMVVVTRQRCWAKSDLAFLARLCVLTATFQRRPQRDVTHRSIRGPLPRHHAPPRRQHRKAASSHPSPPLPGLSPVSSDTKPRARSGAASHSTTTMERGGNPPGEAPQQASEHEGRGDAPTSRGGIYLDSGETTGSPITRPRRRKQS
jgi:hypothetical protein